MTKSAKTDEIEELDELPVVDYSPFSDKLKEILEEKPHIIEKKSKLSWDGKQFIIRIPKEISEEMNITKGNQIKFTVVKPEPGTGGKNELKIDLVV
ncbi:hypothetical protein MmiHf6_07270 [Methanimicrococcus hongohii]|uniref:Uncharacterized protein n=1 Tax=Methanimicrococcus hongohii TaxID=3028295 RepID=A0AA96ZSG0_9EURY|nr:hypothetical protein [Methanimicrococcus sp. Hf6]WNY23420.1 hypothetical protein MmiHf6_07270 [Methanimicrococcus sp. Hf6]